jgi:hypothetical protein
MNLELGAVAFWIFLAAVVIAVIWRNKHRETIRHETLRFLIEKNQKIDAAQLAQLLNPTPPPSPEWLWGPKHRPGDAYKKLRILGTILMFAAVGLAVVGFWRGALLGMREQSVLEIASAVPLLAMLGLGLFVSSRFCPPPTADGDKDKQGP